MNNENIFSFCDVPESLCGNAQSANSKPDRRGKIRGSNSKVNNVDSTLKTKK